MASPRPFNEQVLRCRRCPRLVAALADYRQQHPQTHSAPVPPSGPAQARLLIVGLAPGRHGANRTGRVFVGDASGRFLFAALARAGLASDADPFTARLRGLRMTNVLKCWPPGNQPETAELARCADHLRQELAEFWPARARAPRALLCLGKIAHDAVRKALTPRLPATHPALPEFTHGGSVWVTPTLKLVSSYHPSAQNVNTGRLNAAMLDTVLQGFASAAH